jgi:hypothetical protein
MGDDEYRFICLPGSEIPNWFSCKGIGSSISFRAPSISNGQFLRLLFSAVYAYQEKKDGIYDWIHDHPHVWITNKTRGNLVIHTTVNSGTYTNRTMGNSSLYPKKDHFILCLTPLIRNKYELESGAIFYELVMESGDEIEVFIDLCRRGNVKKCGVHLLLVEPNVT